MNGNPPVRVSGEAGAGKTRLALETIEDARQRDMATLVGHCLDMDAPLRTSH